MESQISCLCYTSESRALATLEYTVNINIDFIPRALSIVEIEIPDGNMEIFSEDDLPGDWWHSPAPSSSKEFGTKILKAAKTAIIKIPSAVIKDEYNYLLNPIHPESALCKVISIKDFVYDVRIKLT